MIDYTNQSAGSIRFYLFRGDFEMSQFTVLEHTSVVHNDVHLNIAILGESHFVRIEHAGQIISEICACSDVRVDNPENLIAHDFLPNIHSVPVTSTLHKRQYSFTFSYENWKRGTEHLADLRSNMSDMHAISLKHIFPSRDYIQEEATTEIYTVLKDEIRTYTVHTYPNEHVMVFTESRLSA